MIIAIDGPAASGKSTTARLVASKLNITYLDTGAMYRVVTLAVIEQKIDLSNSDQLDLLLKRIELTISTEGTRTKILRNGTDVSDQIRSLEVTDMVSTVSAVPAVRKAMVMLQRKIGTHQDCVVEGRDIGTVVFPKADFKFFIIADYATRAARRKKDLLQLGQHRSIDELIEDLKTRDRKDSTRSHSPLLQAPDAIVIDTSNLTIEQQITLIVDQVKSRSNKVEK